MAPTWSWTTTGYSFVGRSVDEIIQTCQHAGLAGIEAAAEVFPTQAPDELRRVAARFAAAGLGIDTYHLPFGAEHDIAGFYETTRRQAVQTMATHLERAACLGARAAIQHPTTTRFDVQTEGLERYLEAIGRSLETLLPRCADLGITLAVENMLPGPMGGPGQTGHRFASQPEHFALLASRWPHPCLGFCLDTGHALVAGGPQGAAALFAAMAPRLAAFHLADNAGDRDSHLAPGHGLVDWTTFFRQAATLRPGYPLCIETAPFAHGPGGLFPPEAWRAMVTEVQGLADRAAQTPA